MKSKKPNTECISCKKKMYSRSKDISKAICTSCKATILVEKPCECCGNTTTNPRFCSKTCAIKIINKEVPKRKLSRKCVHCDNIIRAYNSSLCEEHYRIYNNKERIKSTPLKVFHSKSSVKDKHPSWKNSEIRNFARSWNKHLIKLPCANCGYSKHVELCHIVPISNFPLSATLEEVNNPDNIVQLCRNCHWEFDHGLLLISEIRQL